MEDAARTVVVHLLCNLAGILREFFDTPEKASRVAKVPVDYGLGRFARPSWPTYMVSVAQVPMMPGLHASPP